MAHGIWRSGRATALAGAVLLSTAVVAPSPAAAQDVARPDVTRDIGNGIASQFARERLNQKSQAKQNSSGMELQSAKKEAAKKDTKKGGAQQQPQQAARVPTGVPPANERRYVPDQVVIQVATTMTAQQTAALAQRFRLAVLQSVDYQLGGTTLVLLRIPDRRSVPVVVRALETDATVLFAQPNYLYELADEARPEPVRSEGDPSQWELDKMHLSQAHELARGGRILVAVVDSGVDVGHPDLAGDIAGALDVIPKIGVPIHFHGTGVAGAIAAHGQLMGAAPSAQILAIRAFSGDAKATGTTFDIAQGLDKAVERHARVINMSFAGAHEQVIGDAVAKAYGKGVVLVAAAGNKKCKSPALYPGAYPGVIAVTSTDRNDAMPEFASCGPHVAVAAPGVDLMLLGPNGSLRRDAGTSFSSAYVSGTAALMLERKPDLTPDALRKALMDSAHHLGGQPINDQNGAGVVDAYQAVRAVAPAQQAVVEPAEPR